MTTPASSGPPKAAAAHTTASAPKTFAIIVDGKHLRDERVAERRHHPLADPLQGPPDQDLGHRRRGRRHERAGQEQEGGADQRGPRPEARLEAGRRRTADDGQHEIERRAQEITATPPTSRTAVGSAVDTRKVLKENSATPRHSVVVAAA